MASVPNEAYMQWEERQTVPLDCEALFTIVCQNIAGISQVITEAE